MKILFKVYGVLKSTKGQSIVEISLITPVLLVALYIPVDFGIAFSYQTLPAPRRATPLGSAAKLENPEVTRTTATLTVTTRLQ